MALRVDDKDDQDQDDEAELRQSNGREHQHLSDLHFELEVAMLHKMSELLGYHIVATDGEIGHVNDFLVDEGIRTCRYLVVDTNNWIGGKSVLISPTAIEQIDSPTKKIHLNLTRDAIKGAPSVETAQIDPAETLPAWWIM